MAKPRMPKTALNPHHVWRGDAALACVVKGPCMVKVKVVWPPPVGTTFGEKLQEVPLGSPEPHVIEVGPVNPRISAMLKDAVLLPPDEIVMDCELPVMTKSGGDTSIVTGAVVAGLK